MINHTEMNQYGFPFLNFVFKQILKLYPDVHTF